jgi:putative membrane protein
LEKISRSLKDPFENNISDTPMTAICRTIEIDLREMLEEENIPALLEPVKGVLY